MGLLLVITQCVWNRKIAYIQGNNQIIEKIWTPSFVNIYIYIYIFFIYSLEMIDLNLSLPLYP